MLLQNYFDNAATTPVDPRVVEAMLPYFSDHWGNAHSLHQAGSEAARAVEAARQHITALIGAEDPSEIVFTSGATEANNWVLRSFPDAAVSPFEHSSLYESALRLGNPVMGHDGLSVIPPRDTSLLSLMKVNNEIGTIFQPEQLHSTGSLMHSDVTQAVGKVPFELSCLDLASFSAHKFYGPKGVGALYAKAGAFPAPVITGGEQENGLRAGTLNVPAIVGMGAAAQIALDEIGNDRAFASELRQIVLENLDATLDFRVNGGAEVSPFILSVSFHGIEGESMVIEMDRIGYGISGGAACSSRSTEPSHVLTAVGLEPAWLRGTVRISFGRFNTKGAAQSLAKQLAATCKTLRKLHI